MRPIGIDQLSIAVEAAQCGPDECIGVLYAGEPEGSRPLRVNPACAVDFGIWSYRKVAQAFVATNSECSSVENCMCAATYTCYEKTNNAPDRN